MPKIRPSLTRLAHDLDTTVRAAAITALSHRFADRYLSRNDFSGSLYAAIAVAARSQSTELHTAVSMNTPFLPPTAD